jgi:hypothetical protein
MKRISNKQSVINKRLAEIYNQLANEREHVCSGCGRGDLPLSHSHIIPRSRRKDLICEGANITYHCLSINGGWAAMSYGKAISGTSKSY